MLNKSIIMIIHLEPYRLCWTAYFYYYIHYYIHVKIMKGTEIFIYHLQLKQKELNYQCQEFPHCFSSFQNISQKNWRRCVIFKNLYLSVKRNIFCFFVCLQIFLNYIKLKPGFHVRNVLFILFSTLFYIVYFYEF